MIWFALCWLHPGSNARCSTAWSRRGGPTAGAPIRLSYLRERLAAYPGPAAARAPVSVRRRPAAVPVAGTVLDALPVHRTPPIARARQNRFKLAFDQFFDEGAHLIAHGILNRIEPGVEKERRSWRRQAEIRS